MQDRSMLLNIPKLGGMKIVNLKSGLIDLQRQLRTGNYLKKSLRRLKDYFSMIKSKKPL